MPDDLQVAQQSGLPTTNSASADPGVKRTAQAPKFRNTDNPAETWRGRGKRPNWLKAQIAAGRSLEDFRIRD
jgi:DNA-binding protein H-NS